MAQGDQRGRGIDLDVAPVATSRFPLEESKASIANCRDSAFWSVTRKDDVHERTGCCGIHKRLLLHTLGHANALG